MSASQRKPDMASGSPCWRAARGTGGARSHVQGSPSLPRSRHSAQGPVHLAARRRLPPPASLPRRSLRLSLLWLLQRRRAAHPGQHGQPPGEVAACASRSAVIMQLLSVEAMPACRPASKAAAAGAAVSPRALSLPLSRACGRRMKCARTIRSARSRRCLRLRRATMPTWFCWVRPMHGNGLHPITGHALRRAALLHGLQSGRFLPCLGWCKCPGGGSGSTWGAMKLAGAGPGMQHLQQRAQLLHWCLVAAGGDLFHDNKPSRATIVSAASSCGW